MASYRIGDRVGVVKGSLQGYYGHVTSAQPCIGIQLMGDRFGENNPRFLSGEWFLPDDYYEHID